MLAVIHVSIKTCKHEIAHSLLALGGGYLDRPDFIARQTKL
jgi:hypothetical protein